MSESFNVSRSFFMNWTKNWKVPIWFKRKIKIFWDFGVFDFALYPRSKTRKSQKFCLPQIAILIVIQDLKMPKKSTETKTKRFQYDLGQKEQFLKFLSFWFCPIPKNKKSKFLEISVLLKILEVVVAQDFKKNELKKWRRMCFGLRRKKLKLPMFPSFWFYSITKIKNSVI